MKTRRILAASTAALLSFGAVAVVASAETTVTVTLEGLPAKAAADSTTASIENAVQVKAVDGDSNSISLTKNTDYTVAVTGDKDNGFTVTVSPKAGSTYTFTAVNANVAAAEGQTTPPVTPPAATTSGSTEIENTKGKWEDLVTLTSGSPAATVATVSYSVTSANASKLKDLTLTATLNTQSMATAGAGAFASSGGALKDLKSSQQTKLATAVANGAIMIDFKVTEEDDDDYGDRTKFKMPAPISLNVTDLTFEANHVYHYENKQLVEVKVDKLTDKKVGSTTTYGIQFTTQSFSPFIITKDVVKGAVALDDEANPANASNSGTTSSGTASSNPNTGIALAIAPVVLAAGAVAVVALKKKH